MTLKGLKPVSKPKSFRNHNSKKVLSLKRSSKDVPVSNSQSGTPSKLQIADKTADVPSVPDASKVKAAVKALMLLLKKKSEKKREKKDLFEEEGEALFLQIGCMKIADGHKFIRFQLRHKFINESSRVCLFVKDLNPKKRNENEPTIDHFKEILRDSGIGTSSITEVISLGQLRSEFKTFEAKRKLSNSFDLFLADSRIVKFMARALGKAFIARKKLPVSIDMTAKDLSSEIDRVLQSTYLPLTNGGHASILQIGISVQSASDIVENLTGVIDQLGGKFPGGWTNVRSLHLKSSSSPAVPVFINFSSPDAVDLKSISASQKKVKPIVGEVSTILMDNVKVRVFPDGRVFTKKMNRNRNKLRLKESSTSTEVIEAEKASDADTNEQPDLNKSLNFSSQDYQPKPKRIKTGRNQRHASTDASSSAEAAKAKSSFSLEEEEEKHLRIWEERLKMQGEAAKKESDASNKKLPEPEKEKKTKLSREKSRPMEKQSKNKMQERVQETAKQSKDGLSDKQPEAVKKSKTELQDNPTKLSRNARRRLRRSADKSGLQSEKVPSTPKEDVLEDQPQSLRKGSHGGVISKKESDVLTDELEGALNGIPSKGKKRKRVRSKSNTGFSVYDSEESKDLDSHKLSPAKSKSGVNHEQPLPKKSKLGGTKQQKKAATVPDYSKSPSHKVQVHGEGHSKDGGSMKNDAALSKGKDGQEKRRKKSKEKNAVDASRSESIVTSPSGNKSIDHQSTLVPKDPESFGSAESKKNKQKKLKVKQSLETAVNTSELLLSEYQSGFGSKASLKKQKAGIRPEKSETEGPNFTSTPKKAGHDRNEGQRKNTKQKLEISIQSGKGGTTKTEGKKAPK